MMSQLSVVAVATRGVLLGEDHGFDRVTTDTRQLRRGDLFVALKGEHFDGRDFVLRAASLGAAGSLVSSPVEGAPAQVVVADTLTALQVYAGHWRSQFKLPLVGITGSNGKTTTKQMLAAIAATLGPVLATQGNYNNHIGVPLTLLGIRADHASAVIEMGANHAGEIANLAKIALPTIGIVTLAGDAHLEGFGTHQAIAEAKGELFAALQGGIAIINADDAFAPLWRKLAARASIIEFGFSADAAVRAEAVQLSSGASRFLLRTPLGDAPVDLALPGRHNIANALAAAAGAVALGIQAKAIAAGLASVQPVSGRLSWRNGRDGMRVLDDSYNASPSSLRAALELMAALPGERWLVLGDMKELGANALEMHRQAGAAARALGIQRLYSTGLLARAAAEGFGPDARHFDSIEALIQALIGDARADVAVLVKGSRSSRMERVVAALSHDPPVGVH